MTMMMVVVLLVHASAALACTRTLGFTSTHRLRSKIRPSITIRPTWKVHPGEEENALAGEPLGPTLFSSEGILVRYIYEGGKLSRDSRLVSFDYPTGSCFIESSKVLEALANDGVDFEHFKAAAFEPTESGGSWLPIDINDGRTFDLRSVSSKNRPRVDIKLFRREPPPVSGALENDGFYGIGIVGAKTTQNIGSLWRSAFQLGASYIFTVGHRYKKTEATDTMLAHKRMPLFEWESWSDFVESSQPKGAQWVAVEFGGEPLETFEHPARAIYILGSEDNGLPESVVKACHSHVTLPATRYESFNVAMAGSIIAYDRLAKQKMKSES